MTMRKTYNIYSIYNKINGKRYIGFSCRFEQRMKFHRRAKTPIGKAIRKYGWENFTKRILESDLTLQQAKNQERFYIKKYNCKSPNGYNQNEGGAGHNPCAAIRAKQKATCKNRSPKKQTEVSDNCRIAALDAWQDSEYKEAHLKNRRKRGQKRPEMIGQKYGRLIVKSYAKKASKIRLKVIKRDHYYCDCSCGKINFIICGESLRSGHSRSCGCIRKEQAAINGKIGGGKTKRKIKT